VAAAGDPSGYIYTWLLGLLGTGSARSAGVLVRLLIVRRVAELAPRKISTWWTASTAAESAGELAATAIGCFLPGAASSSRAEALYDLRLVRGLFRRRLAQSRDGVTAEKPRAAL